MLTFEDLFIIMNLAREEEGCSLKKRSNSAQPQYFRSSFSLTFIDEVREERGRIAYCKRRSVCDDSSFF